MSGDERRTAERKQTDIMHIDRETTDTILLYTVLGRMIRHYHLLKPR